MDKIYLNGMEFYAYHGALPEETVLGQRFRMDITLETDLKEAGTTDQLEKTINYAEVYDMCKQIVEKETYLLIESVAEKTAGIILENFSRVRHVKVKLTKPNPPINGIYESVAVEISRSRHE